MKVKRVRAGCYRISTPLSEYMILSRYMSPGTSWQLLNGFGSVIDYCTSKHEALQLIEQREAKV